MARCPVRRFKPGARVRGTQLTALHGEGIKWRTTPSKHHVTGWRTPAPTRWRGGFLRSPLLAARSGPTPLAHFRNPFTPTDRLNGSPRAAHPGLDPAFERL